MQATIRDSYIITLLGAQAIFVQATKPFLEHVLHNQTDRHMRTYHVTHSMKLPCVAVFFKCVSWEQFPATNFTHCSRSMEYHTCSCDNRLLCSPHTGQHCPGGTAVLTPGAHFGSRHDTACIGKLITFKELHSYGKTVTQSYLHVLNIYHLNIHCRR